MSTTTTDITTLGSDADATALCTRSTGAPNRRTLVSALVAVAAWTATVPCTRAELASGATGPATTWSSSQPQTGVEQDYRSVPAQERWKVRITYRYQGRGGPAVYDLDEA